MRLRIWSGGKLKKGGGGMTRKKLKLNDFEGFKRYLKTLEKTGWGVFYDEENNLFTPPIPKPKTLPEYQLDHYAMWMVIYAYGLKEKPDIHYAAHTPLSCCYACEYSKNNKNRLGDLCGTCPIVLDDTSARGVFGRICALAYTNWRLYGDKKFAYEIAHLEWREVT